MRELKLPELLSLVDLDAPAMGILGRGYPTSFYRVSVLINGRWWAFDNSAFPVRLHGRAVSPAQVQQGIRPERRAEVAVGTLRELLTFDHHPDKRALCALMARGAELLSSKGAA